MSESAPPSPMTARSGPKGALSSFFKQYGQFKGYAARGEFWWPWLVLALLYLATGITAAILVATSFSDGIVTETYDPPGTAEFSQRVTFTGAAGTVVNIALLCYLALFVATISPLMAVTWRRFHDAGMPGPMFFLWFIPLIGWLIVLIMLALPSEPTRRRPTWDAPPTAAPVNP